MLNPKNLTFWNWTEFFNFVDFHPEKFLNTSVLVSQSNLWRLVLNLNAGQVEVQEMQVKVPIRAEHGSVRLGFDLKPSYEPNPLVSSESKTKHIGFLSVRFQSVSVFLFYGFAAAFHLGNEKFYAKTSGTSIISAKETQSSEKINS